MARRVPIDHLGPRPTLSAVAVALSKANPALFDPPLTSDEVLAAARSRDVEVREGRLTSIKLSVRRDLADIYFGLIELRDIGPSALQQLAAQVLGEHYGNGIIRSPQPGQDGRCIDGVDAKNVHHARWVVRQDGTIVTAWDPDRLLDTYDRRRAS